MTCLFLRELGWADWDLVEMGNWCWFCQQLGRRGMGVFGMSLVAYIWRRWASGAAAWNVGRGLTVWDGCGGVGSLYLVCFWWHWAGGGGNGWADWDWGCLQSGVWIVVGSSHLVCVLWHLAGGVAQWMGGLGLGLIAIGSVDCSRAWC